jgi:hypothetical protein
MFGSGIVLRQFGVSGLNGLGMAILRLGLIGIACALLYQAYDSIQSGWLGHQPKTSAPNKNPKDGYVECNQVR